MHLTATPSSKKPPQSSATARSSIQATVPASSSLDTSVQALERPLAIIYQAPHSTPRYIQLTLPFNGTSLGGWGSLDSIGAETLESLIRTTTI